MCYDVSLKMTPVTLNHSRKAVRRAGECLIQDPDDFDQFLDAYNVLENWRSSHAYPIQSMLGYFRAKAFSIDSKAIVARRLKRTPSILAKLNRESGMKLDRMEDIGGVRIVTTNLAKVESIVKSIKTGRTRNILRRERDYITYPKESGYRGVHLVYKYNGAKEGFPCHHIELQIRTQTQHAWATTVEVVGMYTRQSLKAGIGTKEWLDFFSLAGEVFANIDSKKDDDEKAKDQREELIKQVDRLGVLTRLQAYAVSTKHINESKKDGKYYLLILDTNEEKINIWNHNDLTKASDMYASLEKQHKDDKDIDVVLVSTESLKGLKLAYPNYFADTTQFRQRLRKLMITKLI